MQNQEVQCNRLQVNSSEFAAIVGVDKSTVSRAIKNKRLTTSISEDEDGNMLIEVYQACIEWFLRKQSEKDRFSHDPKRITESKARKEHYQSLIKKLEYEIMTGKSVSVEEVIRKGQEICLGARRYLEERRDQDALILPTFNDDFETRKLLRERDDGFLNALADLARVGVDVAKETMEKYKNRINIDDIDEENDENNQ